MLMELICKGFERFHPSLLSLSLSPLRKEPPYKDDSLIMYSFISFILPFDKHQIIHSHH